MISLLTCLISKSYLNGSSIYTIPCHVANNMWQFKTFIFIVIFKESFCNGNLNRVYFTKRDLEDGDDTFCVIDDDNSNYAEVYLEDFTETELKEKCKDYQFAEINQCDNAIAMCCNEIGHNNMYYTLATNVEEKPLCGLNNAPDDRLYGVELIANENSNLFDLQSDWYTVKTFNQSYKYIGCVLNSALSSSSDHTGIIAIKVSDSLSGYTEINVNRSSGIRIWDFAGDCHNTILSSSSNVPFPAGKQNPYDGSRGNIHHYYVIINVFNFKMYSYFFSLVCGTRF